MEVVAFCWSQTITGGINRWTRVKVPSQSSNHVPVIMAWHNIRFPTCWPSAQGKINTRATTRSTCPAVPRCRPNDVVVGPASWHSRANISDSPFDYERIDMLRYMVACRAWLTRLLIESSHMTMLYGLWVYMRMANLPGNSSRSAINTSKIVIIHAIMTHYSYMVTTYC